LCLRNLTSRICFRITRSPSPSQMPHSAGSSGRSIFKADMLGKHFIAVDPWGTSQFCYNCLSWVPKGLSERDHKCEKCSAVLDRDLNSAKLIKRLGILRRPPSDGGLSLAEQVPLPSLRMMASASIEAGSPHL